MQVLKAPSKDGSTRVGDVTLGRERCLVDALQRQTFMRVSAIRSLFRGGPSPACTCCAVLLVIATPYGANICNHHPRMFTIGMC